MRPCGTKVILYWRPTVQGWNDNPGTMAGVLEVGRHLDAAVFTGFHAARVRLLVREDALSRNMSRYLAVEIERHPTPRSGS
ncbi:hypothetical protein GCM10022226_39470 [Sphaerisporangium flaviroseum]|uniref:Uncharacterized protein n=1 Tax=Sphaerisporangium flaviroseum TaxID=509199 RepID=A0ABP7ICA8_9ACTN